MTDRARKTARIVWIYDPERDALEEIATRERLADFTTPQLLLKDGRMLVQVIRQDKTPQTFSVNLDGTDAREVTRADAGLPYGLSLSPDGRRLAFHLAGRFGYRIWPGAAPGSAGSMGPRAPMSPGGRSNDWVEPERLPEPLLHPQDGPIDYGLAEGSGQGPATPWASSAPGQGGMVTMAIRSGRSPTALNWKWAPAGIDRLPPAETSTIRSSSPSRRHTRPVPSRMYQSSSTVRWATGRETCPGFRVQ